MSNLRETKPFGIHLDITLKLIKQDLIRRFREHDIDLTPEQWTILAELTKKESIYQRELAEGTFKDAPTVSRIIDLLNKRGYITRQEDEDDRRRFLISLTPSGRAIYDQSAPLVYESRKVGWDGLSDQDFVHLSRILGRISSNITTILQD